MAWGWQLPPPLPEVRSCLVKKVVRARVKYVPGVLPVPVFGKYKLNTWYLPTGRGAPRIFSRGGPEQFFLLLYSGQ